MEDKNIVVADFSKEMQERYLLYALDVIKDRALADVRDGLKPVHRRILYTTSELALLPEKGYRKCVRVVGDCLGKFHPHGDSSVYGALVRMAQDFSLRYPLIDGHGNFGSVDGDNAAAMRYTECKMSKITMEMLKDLDKDTVEFVPNFDEEEIEPTVLTSRFPNLLCNGTEGIAVGMASSIPSHNLGEVIDGIIHVINNPDCEVVDLLQYIKAPDFPTGGEIINPEILQSMYETGNGKILVRSKYHFEELDKMKQIVFTEIPYQINKAKTLEKIADLVKDKIIEGVSDVRDESDREGMRIVIDLKNKANANVILAQLFKKTGLQDTYGVNMCVLVDKAPRVLNLKQVIEYYISFQKEVILKKSQYNLDKANTRVHILEGLLTALDTIDDVVKIIRGSKNKSDSKLKLIKEIQVDEIQAEAILELKLHRLTSLDMDNLRNEIKSLNKLIKSLTKIINSKNSLTEVLIEDLIEIKNKYTDNRRTSIKYEKDIIQDVKIEKSIESYSTTIILTKNQYIKKTLKYADKSKQAVKEGDEVSQILQTNNVRDLLLFTNQGRVYTRKIYELLGRVECQPSSQGEYIPNLIKDLQPNEKIIYIASPENYDKGYMLYTFQNSNILKMAMNPYSNKQNRQVAQDAYLYEEANPLRYIKYITEDIDLLAVTTEGKALIINTNEINPKTSNGGKKSQGNPFIKLESSKFKNNSVVEIVFEPTTDNKFTVTTEKREFEFGLNDIADNGKIQWEYLQGKRMNSGNMIYNCRQKKDRITGVS